VEYKFTEVIIMSCVHYKFKSQQDYDTLTFDGLHISVADLKRAIKDKNKMMVGLSDSDLQITDAQSKKVFEHDKDLIQRNSSVIVARVPLQSQSKIRLPKFTNQKAGASGQPGIVLTRKGGSGTAEAGSSTRQLTDTANVAGSDMDEESKLKQIREVSTRDYDPKNFPRANRSMFFWKTSTDLLMQHLQEDWSLD